MNIFFDLINPREGGEGGVTYKTTKIHKTTKLLKKLMGN